MPLSSKAQKVMDSMKKQYGAEEGERVFYSTANKQGRKAETWTKESAACCGTKLKKVLKKAQSPEEHFAGEVEEMEHTDKPAVAKRIAKDHLEEDTDYYKKLDRAGLFGEKTAGLKAVLQKRAEYYEAKPDDEEDDKPSLMWNVLGGAGLGGASGVALGGGYGALNNYADYKGRTEPTLNLAKDIATESNLPPPYFEMIDKANQEAGGSPSGAAWKGFRENSMTPGLIGAGVGAGAGLLRYFLNR